MKRKTLIKENQKLKSQIEELTKNKPNWGTITGIISVILMIIIYAADRIKDNENEKRLEAQKIKQISYDLTAFINALRQKHIDLTAPPPLTESSIIEKFKFIKTSQLQVHSKRIKLIESQLLTINEKVIPQTIY